MDITRAQAIIIRRVCNIQIESLEQVIMAPNLEPENEEILNSFSVPREDFDGVIIGFRGKFIELRDNPEKVYELDYEGLMIFLFILSHVKGELSHKYPNAIKNLGDKVYQMTGLHENLN